MTAEVSSVTDGVTGQGLGGLTGALQSGLGAMMNTGQSLLDRFIPPKNRENMEEKLTKFATEKPMFASFLLSQIALSGAPLALFAVMTVGVFAVAIVAALVIAVVGALLFTVVCVGFALIILLPTLFMTSFAAAFIWLWGMGAYYILKWFNKTDIPGIHTPMADGMLDQSGLKDHLPNNEGNEEDQGPRKNDTSNEENEKKLEQAEKQQQQRQTGGNKGNAVRENSPSVAKNTGANAGAAGNVTKKANAGGVSKTVDGAKGQDPGAGAVNGAKG